MTDVLNDEAPDNALLNAIKELCQDGKEVSEKLVVEAFYYEIGREDRGQAESILHRFELEGIIERRRGLSLTLVAEPSADSFFN
jgi:hypothetical protein